jgi:hypothetical protein
MTGGRIGAVLSDLILLANQSFRRNSTDTGWEAFTPSAPGAVAWGDLTGILSNQTDLQTALDAKADVGTGGGGAVLLASQYDPNATSGVLLCSQYNVGA